MISGEVGLLRSLSCNCQESIESGVDSLVNCSKLTAFLSSSEERARMGPSSSFLRGGMGLRLDFLKGKRRGCEYAETNLGGLNARYPACGNSDLPTDPCRKAFGLGFPKR